MRNVSQSDEVSHNESHMRHDCVAMTHCDCESVVSWE